MADLGKCGVASGAGCKIIERNFPVSTSVRQVLPQVGHAPRPKQSTLQVLTANTYICCPL